ncbi:MAG: endolytic transglycosylase MltG [Pseudomonadota bacterium]
MRRRNGNSAGGSDSGVTTDAALQPRPRRFLRRLFFATFANLFLLAIIVAGAVWYAWDQFHAPGPLAEPRIVVVPRGAGVDTIARKLRENGVVANGEMVTWAFTWATRLYARQKTLKAGEFEFPAEISMRGALDLIAEGKSVARRFTVAEGLTTQEILGIIEGTEGLSGPIPKDVPEGVLMPETYHFTRGDTREMAVTRMQQSMEDTLAELWPKRADGLPLKTPEEALVLASIVEKETGVGAERHRVAGVFINRLNRGMRLQSDPTVVYAVTGGTGPLGRGLRRSELDRDHPYNTYARAGLPPGPIANPGRAAIEAVLNPEETDFLYFVADGTGGHAFSKTLAEHNRNVRVWRRIERERKSQ